MMHLLVAYEAVVRCAAYSHELCEFFVIHSCTPNRIVCIGLQCTHDNVASKNDWCMSGTFYLQYVLSYIFINHTRNVFNSRLVIQGAECPYTTCSFQYDCPSFTNRCGTRLLVTVRLPHPGTAIQLLDFRPSAGNFIAHSHSRTIEMTRDQASAIQPSGLIMSPQITTDKVHLLTAVPTASLQRPLSFLIYIEEALNLSDKGQFRTIWYWSYCITFNIISHVLHMASFI